MFYLRCLGGGWHRGRLIKILLAALPLQEESGALSEMPRPPVPGRMGYEE